MIQLKKAQKYTPSENDTPWHRLGGSEPVKALTEAFYDEMERSEPELLKVHHLDADGKIPREFRDKFGMFLVGWLGGPQDYMATHGHPRLRMRHGRVAIGEELRDAWVRCMKKAMDARNIDGDVRAYLDTRFTEVADFLRNIEGK